MTLILGLNAYHHDTAACILRDGEIVAAAEEERFTRVKHWAGFPVHAIRYCLAEARATLADLDHVAINVDPAAPRPEELPADLATYKLLTEATQARVNAFREGGLERSLAEAFPAEVARLRARLHHIEHHTAHLASSFLVSPFDTAALVSVDALGDMASTMWGRGDGNRITVDGRVFYPHSLGFLYLAVCQHLGFPNYGDEYKVMGLASYGRPTRMAEMEQVVRLRPDGTFALGLDYFRHHTQGLELAWEGGVIKVGRFHSDALLELLGPAREPGAPIEDRHKDIAASLQATYERALFHLLESVRHATGETALCLAGGCAMNSVANGKIYDRTGFRRLYVQAAAGDAGGALGAAFAVWHGVLGQPRGPLPGGGRAGYVMRSAFLGPGWSDAQLAAVVDGHRTAFAAAGCTVTAHEDDAALCRHAAEHVAAGHVVGWFQGRMEWGPRALGNRSILGDPRRADMKDILNLKIKRRESFRPFAPAILREAVPDWFETDDDVPFMLQVYQIRPERRSAIPAVTHVNGSGRLQTVTEAVNGRYHRVIAAFERLTGVPIVLNTSFNENEPVVCRPEEAIACFLRTRMDVLVLGRTVVERALVRPARP